MPEPLDTRAENPLKSQDFSGFSMQIVRFSKKRYSLIIAAQSLRCGFDKLEFDELSIMLRCDSKFFALLDC